MITSTNESAAEELLPLLNQGLARLGDTDRTALLLHYYEHQPISAITRMLGLNESAARKRVTRAVEKLRRYFVSHGVSAAPAAIPIVLSSLASDAAPAHLASALQAAALNGSIAAAASTAATGAALGSFKLAKAAMQLIFWSNVKTAAVIVASVVVVGSATVTTVQYARADAVKPAPPPAPQTPQTVVVRPAAASANPDTDPMRRKAQGDALAAQGKSAEALEEYLWCFDHGLEFSKSFVGVRGSFLLESIAQLGKKYPPAAEVLEERYKTSMASVVAGGANDQSVMDYASLARVLGKSDEALKVYDQLKALGPGTLLHRKILGIVLTNALLEARRYKDILEHSNGNPIAAAEAQIRNMGVVLESVAKRLDSADEKQLRLNDQVTAGIKLQVIRSNGPAYEALLGEKHTDEARALADTLLNFDPSPEAVALLVAHAQHAQADDEAKALKERVPPLNDL